MQSPRASSCVTPTIAAFAVAELRRQALIDRVETISSGDDESHEEAVKLAAAVCGTPAAILSFTDRGRQRLTARFGLDALECPRALFFCAQALQAPDRVMIVPDVAEDPRFARSWGKAGGRPFRFYAGAPLLASHGEPLGMISVLDRTRRQLTDTQTSALRGVARQIARQLRLGQENTALRAANARLAELSLTDVLTGIANRRAFNERLADAETRARQTGEPLSLLLMDVDHFKLFNDRYGHPTGDEALFRIAATLKGSNRATDLLARYGGEEFALILPQTRLDAAAAAAERLRAAIEAAEMPSQRVITLSIGAAVFDPAGGAAGLIAAADRALYCAKATGRNRVVAAANEAICFR